MLKPVPVSRKPNAEDDDTLLVGHHHLPRLAVPVLVSATKHLTGRDNRLMTDRGEIGVLASGLVDYGFTVQYVEKDLDIN